MAFRKLIFWWEHVVYNIPWAYIRIFLELSNNTYDEMPRGFYLQSTYSFFFFFAYRTIIRLKIKKEPSIKIESVIV